MHKFSAGAYFSLFTLHFCHPKPNECEHAVKHQQFVAEMIVPKLLSKDVEGVAEDW